MTDAKGHYPTALDKWLLVRYKKFANKNEIPNNISSVMMRGVHDRARVHASIGLMVISAIGMFVNVLIGKYKVKQGHNIYDMEQQYQLDYNKRKESEFK